MEKMLEKEKEEGNGMEGVVGRVGGERGVKGGVEVEGVGIVKK